MTPKICSRGHKYTNSGPCRICWPGNKKLHEKFSANLLKSPNAGGWTYVSWPNSAKFFGTKGLVKVRGTIDGHPFKASFMAMGNGKHMLPVKTEVRKAIGKEAGKTVVVRLQERLK
jgi:hypothetical protein